MKVNDYSENAGSASDAWHNRNSYFSNFNHIIQITIDSQIAWFYYTPASTIWVCRLRVEIRAPVFGSTFVAGSPCVFGGWRNVQCRVDACLERHRCGRPRVRPPWLP